MSSKLSLITLTLFSVALLLAFRWDNSVSHWLVALIVMSFPIALMVLAISRRAEWRIAMPALVFIWFVLNGSVAVMLVSEDAAPSFIGLPIGILVMVVGLWLVPIVVLGLGYALSFDRLVLRQEDQAWLERHGRERSVEAAKSDVLKSS